MWAAAVLADGTMVTGDGGGNVQFWSAAHGTLISSHRLHIAAVLAVAGDPSGALLFAAGIDHQIGVFQKIEADKGNFPAFFGRLCACPLQGFVAESAASALQALMPAAHFGTEFALLTKALRIPHCIWYST